MFVFVLETQNCLDCHETNVARKSNALENIYDDYIPFTLKYMDNLCEFQDEPRCHFRFGPYVIFEIRVWADINQWNGNIQLKPKKHYYYHRAIWFLCGKMCAHLVGMFCVCLFSFIHLTMELWFGCLVVYVSFVWRFNISSDKSMAKDFYLHFSLDFMCIWNPWV